MSSVKVHPGDPKIDAILFTVHHAFDTLEKP